MIGGRIAAGVAGALVLGAVLGQRLPGVAGMDPASRASLDAGIVADREVATAVLARLRDRLAAGIADARDGAALTVQLSDRPGAHLESAGRTFADADALSFTARQAVGRLRGDLAIVGRDGPSLELDAGELASIGGELTGSAAAADGFWAMHRSSETALAAIQQALAALARSDPTAALTALDIADASLAEVRAVKIGLDTLPVWLDTSTRLTAALRQLATAVRDGDRAAAKAAEQAYAAAAADARRADLGLAIAIAEGGSAMTATPLSAAADALSAVDAAIAGVAATAGMPSILG